MVKNLSLTYLVILILGTRVAFAQGCGSCTVSIASLDTSVYVVSSGQVFCITELGVFKGTVTVNGGTLCNQGDFQPKTFIFNSGVVTNKSRAKIESAITLSSGKTFNNATRSITTLKGLLTLSGGTLFNEGILNVDANIQNNSGSFINNSILNCNQLLGNNSVSNIGIINTD